jgi:nucleotide-binding universal stress UspA family protein
MNRNIRRRTAEDHHIRARGLRGEPVRYLLGAVAARRAELLVVAARGTSGVGYLLLGSVAEGALNQSPVAVLVAR